MHICFFKIFWIGFLCSWQYVYIKACGVRFCSIHTIFLNTRFTFWVLKGIVQTNVHLWCFTYARVIVNLYGLLLRNAIFLLDLCVNQSYEQNISLFWFVYIYEIRSHYKWSLKWHKKSIWSYAGIIWDKMSMYYIKKWTIWKTMHCASL